MTVFAHTKFDLVRIEGSEVKKPPPPRSERVFQIPAQIGLKYMTFPDSSNSYAHCCHFEVSTCLCCYFRGLSKHFPPCESFISLS